MLPAGRTLLPVGVPSQKSTFVACKTAMLLIVEIQIKKAVASSGRVGRQEGKEGTNIIVPIFRNVRRKTDYKTVHTNHSNCIKTDFTEMK